MVSRNAALAGSLGATVIVLAAFSLGGDGFSPPGFGDPLAGLTDDELARFEVGRDYFEEAEEADEGLGPVFNDVSCVACHDQPAAGGGNSTRFETRFGRVGRDGVFNPLTELGGTLIQADGIGPVPGFTFVGEVVPPRANVVAGRRATPLFGLGLVEAVPDSTLLAIAAAQQRDGTPVDGRPSIVIDPPSTRRSVGRFGWKAQHSSLFTFAGDAYTNEMGITTPLFPDEQCPQGNCAALAFNPVPTPNDADNGSLEAFADFMRLLAPPPRGPITQAARAGEVLFSRIGCDTCHVPTLRTGPSPVAALNNVAFHPYSDFLLHDMGSLGDGIVQDSARAREMRTAPLWGLRVVTAFLHDGRATAVGDAILAHDGEARDARNRFARLSSSDKARLVAFLLSL
jgi:CxxC motif-containing protein (DUF1111 family)